MPARPRKSQKPAAASPSSRHSQYRRRLSLAISRYALKTAVFIALLAGLVGVSVYYMLQPSLPSKLFVLRLKNESGWMVTSDDLSVQKKGVGYLQLGEESDGKLVIKNDDQNTDRVYFAGPDRTLVIATRVKNAVRTLASDGKGKEAVFFFSAGKQAPELGQYHHDLFSEEQPKYWKPVSQFYESLWAYGQEIQKTLLPLSFSAQPRRLVVLIELDDYRPLLTQECIADRDSADESYSADFIQLATAAFEKFKATKKDQKSDLQLHLVFSHGKKEISAFAPLVVESEQKREVKSVSLFYRAVEKGLKAIKTGGPQIQNVGEQSFLLKRLFESPSKIPFETFLTNLEDELPEDQNPIRLSTADPSFGLELLDDVGWIFPPLAESEFKKELGDLKTDWTDSSRYEYWMLVEQPQLWARLNSLLIRREQLLLRGLAKKSEYLELTKETKTLLDFYRERFERDLSAPLSVLLRPDAKPDQLFKNQVFRVGERLKKSAGRNLGPGNNEGTSSDGKLGLKLSDWLHRKDEAQPKVENQNVPAADKPMPEAPPLETIPESLWVQLLEVDFNEMNSEGVPLDEIRLKLFVEYLAAQLGKVKNCLELAFVHRQLVAIDGKIPKDRGECASLLKTLQSSWRARHAADEIWLSFHPKTYEKFWVKIKKHEQERRKQEDLLFENLYFEINGKETAEVQERLQNGFSSLEKKGKELSAEMRDEEYSESAKIRKLLADFFVKKTGLSSNDKLTADELTTNSVMNKENYRAVSDGISQTIAWWKQELTTPSLDADLKRFDWLRKVILNGVEISSVKRERGQRRNSAETSAESLKSEVNDGNIASVAAQGEMAAENSGEKSITEDLAKSFRSWYSSAPRWSRGDLERELFASNMRYYQEARKRGLIDFWKEPQLEGKHFFVKADEYWGTLLGQMEVEGNSSTKEKDFEAVKQELGSFADAFSSETKVTGLELPESLSADDGADFAIPSFSARDFEKRHELESPTWKTKFDSFVKLYHEQENERNTRTEFKQADFELVFRDHRLKRTIEGKAPPKPDEVEIGLNFPPTIFEIIPDVTREYIVVVWDVSGSMYEKGYKPKKEDSNSTRKIDYAKMMLGEWLLGQKKAGDKEIELLVIGGNFGYAKKSEEIKGPLLDSKSWEQLFDNERGRNHLLARDVSKFLPGVKTTREKINSIQDEIAGWNKDGNRKGSSPIGLGILAAAQMVNDMKKKTNGFANMSYAIYVFSDRIDFVWPGLDKWMDPRARDAAKLSDRSLHFLDPEFDAEELKFLSTLFGQDYFRSFEGEGKREEILTLDLLVNKLIESEKIKFSVEDFPNSDVTSSEGEIEGEMLSKKDDSGFFQGNSREATYSLDNEKPKVAQVDAASFQWERKNEVESKLLIQYPDYGQVEFEDTLVAAPGAKVTLGYKRSGEKFALSSMNRSSQDYQGKFLTNRGNRDFKVLVSAPNEERIALPRFVLGEVSKEGGGSDFLTDLVFNLSEQDSEKREALMLDYSRKADESAPLSRFEYRLWYLPVDKTGKELLSKVKSSSKTKGEPFLEEIGDEIVVSLEAGEPDAGIEEVFVYPMTKDGEIDWQRLMKWKKDNKKIRKLSTRENGSVSRVAYHFPFDAGAFGWISFKDLKKVDGLRMFCRPSGDDSKEGKWLEPTRWSEVN